MPVSGSGVMFVVYITPRGVAILKPPAKDWPRGMVWQTTQSPTRARYSPRATRAGSLAAESAAVAAPPAMANKAMAAAQSWMKRTMGTLLIMFGAFPWAGTLTTRRAAG